MRVIIICEEKLLFSGLAIIDKSNNVLFLESIDIEGFGKIVRNLITSNKLDNLDRAKRDIVKIKIDGYYAHVCRINDYYLTIFHKVERIGNLLKSSFIAQWVRNRLSMVKSKRDLSKLSKEFKSIIRPRNPNLRYYVNLLSSIIKDLSEDELVKYALTLFIDVKSPVVRDVDQLLKPFRVVNFNDGVKRAIAAAFYGDLIEAFRLALGAIKFKWDNVIALFAFYTGYKLRELPAIYISPSKSMLDDLLKGIKPKSEVEKLLVNYFKLLRKSLDSYKAFLESKAFIRRNIDKIFEIFTSTENIYLKDILSFILSTIDPGVLSRKKIEILQHYIGIRSHILGAYLRAALSRLRSLTLLSARELFIRDVLGYIRWIRSNYLNSKGELIKIIRENKINTGDRETREVLIRYLGFLTEYLRSIYYALSLREMSFSKMERHIREVLNEALEGFKIILEKPPQVPLDQLFEPLEFTALILYFSLPYLNEGDREKYIRGILNLISSLYIIVKRGINEKRLLSKLFSRLFVLFWLSSMLSSKIRDVQPYIIPFGRDILYYINKRGKEITKASEETFVLLVLTLVSSISYLGIMLSSDKREKIFNRISSNLESLLSWILGGRVLQIPLIISLVESLIRLGKSLDLKLSNHKMNYLIAIGRAIVDENIGEARKLIIFDLIGEDKQINYIRGD